MSDQQTCSDRHVVWEGLLDYYDRWTYLKLHYERLRDGVDIIDTVS